MNSHLEHHNVPEKLLWAGVGWEKGRWGEGEALPSHSFGVT